jgi:hypothetical protein
MAASGGGRVTQASGTTTPNPVSGGKYCISTTNFTGLVTGLKILSVMPSA